VFLVPLVAEFQWSRALTAGALSVSTVVQGLCAPLAGVLVDRVGPWPVILGGVLLVCSAILAATIQAPWQLSSWRSAGGRRLLLGRAQPAP